jgi:hypothetical protein
MHAGRHSRRLLRSAALLAFAGSGAVMAEIAIPSWEFAVRPATIRDEAVEASVTNIGKESARFVRLEVAYLEPAGGHGYHVRSIRSNALCPCGSPCASAAQSLRPGERTHLAWDLRSDDCRMAPPGRYQFRLFDDCDFQGCLGTHRFGTGDEFELTP